jgi:hypothetical protein
MRKIPTMRQAYKDYALESLMDGVEQPEIIEPARYYLAGSCYYQL